VPMYEKLGFEAMGEAVPCGPAAFVPMQLKLDEAPREFVARERMYEERWRRVHELA
jgi:hypothetical protein